MTKFCSQVQPTLTSASHTPNFSSNHNSQVDKHDDDDESVDDYVRMHMDGHMVMTKLNSSAIQFISSAKPR